MAAIEYREHDPSGEIFNAETFLQALTLSNKEWWEPGDNTSEWVFRGQGDSNWKLKASAWRDREEGNPLFQLIDKLDELPFHPVVSRRMQQNQVHDIDRTHPIYSWINAELEALFQFAELGNRLGLNVEPIELSPLKTRLKYTGGLLFEKTNTNIAIAQHHGVPTRYLDFSFDPTLAAYHASVFSKGNPTPPDLAVWAINKRTAQSMYPIPDKRSGPGTGPFQSIAFNYSTAFNNPYLHAQSGLFLTVPFAENIFYHEKRWPDLEQLLIHSHAKEPVLIKFILKSEHLTDLREIFKKQGLSKARLMPTLDNVAETIKDNWFA